MRRKILMLQQTLQPPGGASAVAAWILEALKDDYDVTVLTWGPIDLTAVDVFYGTSLAASKVSFIRPSLFVRAILALDPDRNSIQPAAYMMRMCRRLRDNYDLVIAAGMEEMDLGGPGLLYVHYPHLGNFWKTYADSSVGICGLISGKTRPWMMLAGFSVARLKQNRMLTNSAWTGVEIKAAYGVTAQTLYPPVTAPASMLSWEGRENAFVCTGRLLPKKRMDWIIAVLGEVRRQHPGVRLHLVGTRDPGKVAGDFYRYLVDMVQANSDWITLHETLSRDELLRLMGSVKFGIHALIDEHFGLAPAEALMAGCIPFVHDSGGQVEIVSSDPRLCFQDEDAVAKIAAMVRSEAMQNAVRETLAPRRALFAVPCFLEGIRTAVASAIAKR
jgi:glycosyltransferase involved in cell wall biosynthesis